MNSFLICFISHALSYTSLPTSSLPCRLCQHFYGAMLFSDPAIGNYYKRFVRDYMRYHDEIYCAAGKVVKALRKEGAERGFEVDTETEVGGFSAMHIRRGDLQFTSVKFGAEQWWEDAVHTEGAAWKTRDFDAQHGHLCLFPSPTW